MFLDDSSNDRQPEIAADTGNTYISETMKDIINISTTNLKFKFTTTDSLKKCRQVISTVADNRTYQYGRENRKYFYLRNYDRSGKSGVFDDAQLEKKLVPGDCYKDRQLEIAI